MEENNIITWTPADMLEVTIAEPDDFLKVRETLTRIGVASRKENKLFQSCHILHKQGRYFIVHFKELFMLDGKKSNLEQSDLERRNTIATLLSDWGLDFQRIGFLLGIIAPVSYTHLTLPTIYSV